MVKKNQSVSVVNSPSKYLIPMCFVGFKQRILNHVNNILSSSNIQFKLWALQTKATMLSALSAGTNTNWSCNL